MQRTDKAKADSRFHLDKAREGSCLILAYYGSQQCTSPSAILLLVSPETERVFPFFSVKWESIIEKLSHSDQEYLQAIKTEWLDLEPHSERARQMFSILAEASSGALRPALPLQPAAELENCLRTHLHYDDEHIARAIQQIS